MCKGRTVNRHGQPCGRCRGSEFSMLERCVGRIMNDLGWPDKVGWLVINDELYEQGVDVTEVAIRTAMRRVMEVGEL